jgi:hypothetical protein
MHVSNASNDRARMAARRKFLWLRQVFADRSVGHLSCRVAGLLVDHFDLTSGEAWPSQARLAEAAGVTPRGVQKALKALRLAGHLKVRPVRGRNNRYRMVLRPAHVGSPAAVPGTNHASQTDEQKFGLIHKTPLSQPVPSLDAAERAKIGRDLARLASSLSGRSIRGGCPHV